MKKKFFSFVLIFFITVSGARAADLVAKINSAFKSSAGGEISISRTLTSEQQDFLAMLVQWTMNGERYVDLASPAEKELARQGNIKLFVREFSRFSNKQPLHLLRFITKIPGFVGHWQGAGASLPALPSAASIPSLPASSVAALSVSQRSQMLEVLQTQMRTLKSVQEKFRLSDIYEKNIGHLLTALSSDIIFPADDKPSKSLETRRSWTDLEPDTRQATDLSFSALINSLKDSREQNPEEIAIISFYKGNKTRGITLAGLSEKLAVSTFYPDFQARVLKGIGITMKLKEELTPPVKVAVTMAGLLKYADGEGVRFEEKGRSAEKALAQEVVEIVTGRKYGLKNKPLTKSEFVGMYFSLSESVRWLGNFESLVSAFGAQDLARKITRENRKDDIHRRNVFLCACIAWSENDQNREGINLVQSVSRTLGQDSLDTIAQYERINRRFHLFDYASPRSGYRPVQYKDLVD